MGYHLKKIVLSWRFLVLLVLQIMLYVFSNYGNLGRGSYFYSRFVNSLFSDIPLLALLCAVLVGLQTHDELEKSYQPMLYSRISLAGWIRRRFFANILAGGLFIVLPWIFHALLIFGLNFPPKADLVNLQSHPYISIVSDNAMIAVMQMIVLDFVRAFFFGMLLGAVATLGATLLKTRFHSLAFPALFAIVFEHYTTTSESFYFLAWQINFNYFMISGRHLTPWFSYLYFGVLTLLVLALANYFVLGKVRHE